MPTHRPPAPPAAAVAASLQHADRDAPHGHWASNARADPHTPATPPLSPSPHRAVGELSGGVRRLVELLDVFVGRYLLLTTVAYVGIKFVHFKLFDPIPF